MCCVLAARLALRSGVQRGMHGDKMERGSSFAEINGDENGDDEAEARWMGLREVRGTRVGERTGVQGW